MSISGGTLSDRFSTSNGMVDISGGTFSGTFSVSSDSVVNISGGIFSDSFSQRSGTVNISGGTLSGIFSASSDSRTNLFGTQFLLDGVRLSALKVGEAFRITDRNVTLSGLLADGSAFSFELNSESVSGADLSSPDATLTVTLMVPEPASFALLTLGSCLLLWRRWSGSTKS